ncbi:MAG: UvrD-helicase domain-containing protein, partial [Kiritimatiellae bacterium]|nr:UvrD-helicase domain-containing protein [Kiritimatiellia bacterium]
SKRFCHLVMARVQPEVICALTFTRAATREIFEAIVKRLTDDKDVMQPFEVNGALSLTREEALERILEALPRLQISTIDAFSAKIARLFAYDLGLDPDFTLYEGGASSAEALYILDESIRRALSRVDQFSEDELLDLYDVQYDDAAATDSLSKRLVAFLSTFETLLDDHPKGWGDLAALGCADLKHQPGVVNEACQTIQECLNTECAHKGFPSRSRTLLQTMLERYHPEIESVRQLKKVWASGKELNLEKLVEIARCNTFIHYKKETTLSPVLWQSLITLWEDLVARDVIQTANHTRALYRALVALRQAKAEVTEARGLISFEALTKTLAKQVGGKLSVYDAQRFYIAYRLDSAIRHLMIDEFQDTSVAQWQILSGMAHELAADEQESTFFYVGDTKQSIYGWRGGDATLFGDQTRLPAIAEGTPLVMSYRSCPPVIHLVNRLMCLPFHVGGDGKPMETWQEPVAEVWREQWKAHASSPNRERQAGYVQMAYLPKLSSYPKAFQENVKAKGLGNKALWRREVARRIAEHWRQLSGKQASIAVLAEKNSVFQDDEGLLYHLRQAGVPCAIEGKLCVADTPMGALVVQLLHWLSDPRATLWQRIAADLQMTAAQDAQALNLWMQVIHEAGFVRWLDVVVGGESTWASSLTDTDRTTLDAIRKGLEPLDRKGCIEPAIARETVEKLQLPSMADKNVVNLMTIHQSKGLTYTVVFTVLDSEIVRSQQVQCDVGDDWVMERLALSETIDAVPALRNARDRAFESRMRDALCKLYVAITRAEREQIIFAPEASAKSLRYGGGWLFANDYHEREKPAEPKDAYLNYSVVAAPNVHRAFSEDDSQATEYAAEVVFEDGDPNWWHTLEDSVAPEAAKPEKQHDWVREEVGEQIEVALPSEQAKAQTIQEILRKTSGKARDFGIALHDRLAQIEWTDLPVEGVPAEVFKKPSEPCELWRERPFSVQLDSAHGFRYVAGQFDRVHLFPETREAVIYDFKTAYQLEITPAYERQMKDYRTALALLLGYAPEAIRMKLVFTRHQQILEVKA